MKTESCGVSEKAVLCGLPALEWSGSLHVACLLPTAHPSGVPLPLPHRPQRSCHGQIQGGLSPGPPGTGPLVKGQSVQMRSQGAGTSPGPGPASAHHGPGARVPDHGSEGAWGRARVPRGAAHSHYFLPEFIAKELSGFGELKFCSINIWHKISGEMVYILSSHPPRAVILRCPLELDRSTWERHRLTQTPPDGPESPAAAQPARTAGEVRGKQFPSAAPRLDSLSLVGRQKWTRVCS